MDDLISRQAVLDALWLKYCNRPLDSDRYLIKDIRDIINSLPSAQSEPQWIPCSITPPELGVDGNVLLYGKDGNYAVGWYNGCYRSWDDRFDMDTPVAWCKLPEAWRGEEHG